jgi:hypothetical protein
MIAGISLFGLGKSALDRTAKIILIGPPCAVAIRADFVKSRSRRWPIFMASRAMVLPPLIVVMDWIITQTWQLLNQSITGQDECRDDAFVMKTTAIVT